jgi:hypothetical protein
MQENLWQYCYGTLRNVVIVAALVWHRSTVGLFNDLIIYLFIYLYLFFPPTHSTAEASKYHVRVLLGRKEMERSRNDLLISS